MKWQLLSRNWSRFEEWSSKCLLSSYSFLIDFKRLNLNSLCVSHEVTIHWAHGNAVINHTFCVFRWLIFQFPRSPVSCPSFGRHWCPAPDINRDSNVSSVKTDFRCKRSFLSIAGAKVQKSKSKCKSAPVTWTNFFSWVKMGGCLG